MKREKRHVFIKELEKLARNHYEKFKTESDDFVVIGDLDTMRTFSFHIDEIQVKIRIRVSGWIKRKKG